MCRYRRAYMSLRGFEHKKKYEKTTIYDFVSLEDEIPMKVNRYVYMQQQQVEYTESDSSLIFCSDKRQHNLFVFQYGIQTILLVFIA